MRKFIFVLSVIAASAFTTRGVFAGQILQTPAGLSPGDHFRFMFVTTGTTNAISTDITTYDAFVNSDAAGASYNGATIHWLAIGTTLSINATSHIGTTGDAVYLPDGLMVANSDLSTGLWSGFILRAPNEYIDGGHANKLVWTGSNTHGQVATPFGVLGAPGVAIAGLSSSAAYWADFDSELYNGQFALYGISDDLVVSGAANAVPEPSTAMLAGFGGMISLVISYFRLRNGQQRRQPAGRIRPGRRSEEAV